MESDELEEAIFSFLRKRLSLGADDLDRASPLVSSGLVDSGNLVRLATHLERITGISIPDRDIDADHFDTVATILTYVQSKLS